MKPLADEAAAQVGGAVSITGPDLAGGPAEVRLRTGGHARRVRGAVPACEVLGRAATPACEVSVPGGAPGCEVPVRKCGAAAVLLGGGPVRVPFRTCCAAALVQGLRGASGEKIERPG